MDKRHFGMTLRNLRRAQGLTQAGLAERLGLDNHAHISNLERGHKTPSLGLLRQVANLFNIPIDQLLHHDGATIAPEDNTLPTHQLSLRETRPIYTPTSAHDNTENRGFGPQIRALRRRSGLTQAELARILDLASHSYVSQLEHGHKKPSPDLLARTAAFFGVSIADLIEG